MVSTIASKNKRGLEIDFHSLLQVQQSLEVQLKMYDQETQPYVISELSKQVIRAQLFEYEGVLQEIENFSENNRYDWIIFKNCFDTQNLPLTPSNDAPPENGSWKIPAAILMGLISLSGHKVAIKWRVSKVR